MLHQLRRKGLKVIDIAIKKREHSKTLHFKSQRAKDWIKMHFGLEHEKMEFSCPRAEELVDHFTDRFKDAVLDF